MTWAWPLSVILTVSTTYFETGWLSAVCGCSINAANTVNLMVDLMDDHGLLHLFSKQVMRYLP
jgi:hypothetical protein